MADEADAGRLRSAARESRQMAPRESDSHNRCRPQSQSSRPVEAFHRPRSFRNRRVAELLPTGRGVCTVRPILT